MPLARSHPVQHNKGLFPEFLLPSLRTIDFVCPLCHGELEVLLDGYHCPRCDRGYLLQGSIPDFRVFPDPFLSFEEDRNRTEKILTVLDHYRFEPLLEYYWSLSDITPETLRPKFIRSAKRGEQKAKRILQQLNGGTFESSRRAQTVLEIGSGTGNFLAVAMSRYEQIVGIDIAMRWLHLSRRRFMDAGLSVPPLVCCCAEHLPFPDRRFDLIVSAATLECVRDPQKVVSECARALTEGGSFYLNTVNRFSMARDPYVYLWGVGFLPRAWQVRYARWRSGAHYENIQLLSLGKLKRLAARYFLRSEISLPDIDLAFLSEFSRFTRLQVHVYKLLRKIPLLKGLLKWVGPGWDILLQKSE